MKAPFVRVLGVVILTVLLGSLVYGQGEPFMTAKIDFSFEVPHRVMPAGEYSVGWTDTNQTVLMIRGVPPNKQDAETPFITRITKEGTSNEARLVFDKVGDKNILSEVWFPGVDGFLVTATSGKHTHATVKGTVKSSKK